jgi:hypothetical protein
MIVRDRDLDVPPPTPAAFGTIALSTKPNWTAIGFFLTLAFLHACNAVPAFFNLRWEGYLSAMLGSVFLVAAAVLYKSRCDVCFDPWSRQIRLRSGIGRFNIRRAIPFADVHAVRLTLETGRDGRDSRIEVLCDNEDIDCPPTRIPRQQALCLAMMMRVRLIKVVPGGAPAMDESLLDRSPSDLDELPVHTPRS